jgi:maltose alpha-D-glucosyltransferase/alpha-amylase
VQPVELDLAKFQQMVPLELFGHNPFPVITDKPYFLTLGPHAFCWFVLRPRFAGAPGAVPAAVSSRPAELPTLEVEEQWENVLEDPVRSLFEQCLQAYVQPRRWFGGKAREIKSVRIGETISAPTEAGIAVILLLAVDFVEGDPQQYQLPLAFATGAEAQTVEGEYPHMAIARLRLKTPNVEGLLHDGVASRSFARAMLDVMARRRMLKGLNGEAEGNSLPAFRRIRGDGALLEPTPGKAEQSNSAVLFGDKLVLKTFRRLEAGLNPDLEIGHYLAEHDFPHVPPLAGTLEYHARDGGTTGLAILTGFISNCKDAWVFTLDTLGRYYDRVSSLPEEQRAVPSAEEFRLGGAEEEIPPIVAQRLGTYVESARLLGDRTAALHLCLESEKEDPNFAPEPFNPFYQRALFQSMRNQAVQSLGLLRQRLNAVPEAIRPDAERIAALEKQIVARLRVVADVRISGMRLRVHGDYHLGQVLHTGKDFLIIDFEGEPARSLSERRLKRSPLRDVAGMLRSFHYCAFAALYNQHEKGAMSAETVARLAPWARFWSHWAGAIFLRAYLSRARAGTFLPASTAELKTLLEVNLLNKALYELGYELNNRPAWLRIPLEGILELMEQVA